MGSLLAPCLQELWRDKVVKGLVANRAALPANLPWGDLGTWAWPGMPRQDLGSVQIGAGEFPGLSWLKAGGDANAGGGWNPKKDSSRSQAPPGTWKGLREQPLGAGAGLSQGLLRTVCALSFI